MTKKKKSLGGRAPRKITSTRFLTNAQRNVRIRQILKIRGKSMYWFQQQTGLSRTYVYQVLSGTKASETNLTLNTLENMATVLGCTVGMLVDKDPTGGRILDGKEVK